MHILDTLADRFSCDLAIDLGSTNTRIYRKGRGVVVNEPSIIAFERAPGGRVVLDAGTRAKSLFARHHGDIAIMKPVQYGAVADLSAAREMLTRYLTATRSVFGRRPRVIASAPARASRRERECIRQVILSCGIREVYLIEEPRALALGAGLDLSEERSQMVVDIGGGITEMGVIAGGKVLRTAAVPVGGEHMDREIRKYVKKRHQLQIDDCAAEAIKIDIGDACPGTERRSVTVSGNSLEKDEHHSVLLTAQEIRESISGVLGTILCALTGFLRSLSPHESVDILDHGIVLGGGGALLANIDRLIERELAYPVVRVVDPLTCLIRGSGDALRCIDHYGT